MVLVVTDTNLVPFTSGTLLGRGRSDQVVERTGTPVRLFTVRMPFIVEDLDLRSVHVDRLVGFVGQKKDAAVAAGCNLPLEFKIETVKGFAGDEITTTTSGENTCVALDGPLWRDVIAP